jgi:hypothetical protein
LNKANGKFKDDSWVSDLVTQKVELSYIKMGKLGKREALSKKIVKLCFMLVTFRVSMTPYKWKPGRTGPGSVTQRQGPR